MSRVASSHETKLHHMPNLTDTIVVVGMQYVNGHLSTGGEAQVTIQEGGVDYSIRF